MTRKLWFQIGIGLLITLLIIKYFMEIYHIFDPIIIIFKTIMIPLLLGGVLYYITEPIQRVLEKRGMPRWGSLSTIVLLLAAIVTAVFMLVGTPIANQVNRLVDNAPTIASQIEQAIDYVIKNREIFENTEFLPQQVEEFIASITSSIQNIAITSSRYFVNFVSGAVSVTFTLILVPFFFIFMLKDHEKFAPQIYDIFSGSTRTWIKKTLEDIDRVLRNYVQGQVLVSFLLATMMFIGYLFIKLEYSILLAMFAFFMNMIPFIGPWISLVPAVIVALIQKPILVVWVCVITLVAQQVESNLITPNVMGKSLDIHPLTVISLVLAAGNIAGFIGIIIAIPTYGVIKVIVQNLYHERQKIKKEMTKSI